MKIEQVPQRRRALVGERVRWVEFGPGLYEGTLSARIDGEEVTDQLDYDERFDVHYHMSDDGATFYYAIHVFADGDDEAAPDARALGAALERNSGRWMSEVAQGNMDPEDLTFAMNILSTPAMLRKHWNESGRDIEAAHAAVRSDVFGL